MLTFLVQGSAREPYKLTAQGSGADLQIFCTCPASRKGGKFCKHAAALLMGDVTRLVHGHEDVIELKSRARSSPLLERALQHIPGKEGPPPELSSFKTLAEVRDRYGEQLAARGWHVSHEARDGYEALCLHKRFKNGNPQRTAALFLAFEAMTWDLIAQPDGSLKKENIRPRQRPWSVGGRGMKTNAWGTLPRALPAFLKAAGIPI